MINKMTEDDCGFCGKSWNSEYHINDECTNTDEDIEEVGEDIK